MRVLQQLDLADRLRCAPLVCRSWCSAAAAATSSITKHFLATASRDSMQHWLVSHGMRVVELRLSRGYAQGISGAAQLYMPCCNLQHCTLWNWQGCSLHTTLQSCWTAPEAAQR